MHNIRHYFATPAAVLAALVFQVAAEAEARGTADIIWQHSSGQVHYWPMLGGERTDGINIFTPVGPDWTLRGVGDVDGDGTADIVWQHSSGQVHYWPMKNGQRMGGINIFTPVGSDWTLRGVGGSGLCLRHKAACSPAASSFSSTSSGSRQQPQGFRRCE